MNYFIRIFIAFFIFYTPFFSYAAKVDWEIRKLSYQRSLEIAEPVVNIEAVRKLVNGANQSAKVQVPVKASTLGSSVKMLIKGGLASAAIIAIVEGVGWVIEDGVVVKKNDPLGVPESIYIEATAYGFDSTKTFTTKNAAVSAFLLKYLGHSNFTLGSHTLYSTVNLPNNKKKAIYTSAYKHGTENTSTRVLVVIHGDVLPETVPISDSELGQAIIDSPSAPTVIPDIYDPNQATDTPARDASTTALDRAIPDSDTDVTTKPKPNKDTDGDGVPDTYDPELPDEGTTTQIPAFCEWASTMCLWYERYLDDSKKLEEHHEEEKTFWQDVKDWFDWTKEPVDDEPQTEEEPDTQGIFDRTFDTAFSLSKECPPDIPFSLETEFFSGSWNISMNWLCIIFTFLGYPLVFLSHCVGLWILYEAVVQREIKW